MADSEDKENKVDEIDAVKLLYSIVIGDIREFKARQWQVTTWAITVLVATIIPVAWRNGSYSNELPSYAAFVLVVIGLWFGIWASAVILRLQASLSESRKKLEKFKKDWPNLGKVYGDPKPCHVSFWQDWYIWLFQILLIATAIAILLWITITPLSCAPTTVEFCSSANSGDTSPIIT